MGPEGIESRFVQTYSQQHEFDTNVEDEIGEEGSPSSRRDLFLCLPKLKLHANLNLAGTNPSALPSLLPPSTLISKLADVEYVWIMLDFVKLRESMPTENDRILRPARPLISESTIAALSNTA